MFKRYVVVLSPEQREQLRNVVSTGSAPAAAINHARILLKADTAPGAPAWNDEQISDAFELSVRTVMRVRQAFVQQGLAAIQRKKRSGPRHYKIDGVLEAQLVALVCSSPPEGRARWSIRLLSDELVKLTDQSTISRETVRQTLKKMNLSPG